MNEINKIVYFILIVFLLGLIIISSINIFTFIGLKERVLAMESRYDGMKRENSQYKYDLQILDNLEISKDNLKILNLKKSKNEKFVMVNEGEKEVPIAEVKNKSVMGIVYTVFIALLFVIVFYDFIVFFKKREYSEPVFKQPEYRFYKGSTRDGAE